MLPSQVPVRTPDQNVDVSWWNTPRTAMVFLENLLLGSGAIAKTDFTLANNQAATNVTGCLFSSSTAKAATVEFHIRRKSSTASRISKGYLHLFWRADDSAWDLMPESFGDDVGTTFSVTAGGQVQYATDNQGGTSYVGLMSFKATTLSV